MWQWQTWSGLPYLTCDLLADWQHGFFTRQFAPREPSRADPYSSRLLQVLTVSSRYTATSSSHPLKSRILPMSMLKLATPVADGLLTERSRASSLGS